jgi:hypothetical protein
MSALSEGNVFACSVGGVVGGICLHCQRRRFLEGTCKHTSVIAGHRVPERSKSRAKPVRQSLLVGVCWLERWQLGVMILRRKGELTTPCLAIVQ